MLYLVKDSFALLLEGAGLWWDTPAAAAAAVGTAGLALPLLAAV
jgi:hypothetical protein